MASNRARLVARSFVRDRTHERAMPLLTRARRPTHSASVPDGTPSEREEARRDLARFIFHGWHVLEPATPLLWNWHIDAVAQHLQAAFEDWIATQEAIARGEDPDGLQRFQQLLVNIPPGTAKSRIVSVYFPAWAWLHWPSWKAIFFSANPRVAVRDSLLTRLVIQSEWYQAWFHPRWRLAGDQNAKVLFRNTEGGFRQASGITAKITGDRADALVVDDPHDAEEVQSKVSRDEVNERWDQAIANRVNDARTSLRIGIMQRLHDEDWAGHVLAQGRWEHVKLPMEYERKNPCTCPTCQHGETAIGWRDPRTTEGEVLHPERFTPAVLAQEHERLGTYGYAGQMQQNPHPAEGGLFKEAWWQFYTELPFRPELWIHSWDLSFGSKSDGASYVVGQLWCRKGPHRYLVDQRRKRLTYAETKLLMRTTLPVWAQTAAGHQASLGRGFVENKANGPAILSDLRDEFSGLIPEQVEKDKVARAVANTPEIESGHVHLPAYRDADGRLIPGREWVQDFIAEHNAFPNGANDDQVDCASQALRHLKPATGKDPGDWANSRAT